LSCAPQKRYRIILKKKHTSPHHHIETFVILKVLQRATTKFDVGQLAYASKEGSYFDGVFFSIYPEHESVLSHQIRGQPTHTANAATYVQYTHARTDVHCGQHPTRDRSKHLRLKY
jgi:hypothetical protein